MLEAVLELMLCSQTSLRSILDKIKVSTQDIFQRMLERTGKAVIAATVFALASSGLEVRFCDVLAIRAGHGFPLHVIGDMAQMLICLSQCEYCITKSSKPHEKIE